MNVALRVQSPPTVQRRGLPTQTPVVLGRRPELRLPRSMLWTRRVPAVFLPMPFQVYFGFLCFVVHVANVTTCNYN